MYLSKFKNIQRLQSINRPFAVVIHMYMYYKTALLEGKRAYCISRTRLDWTGLVKHGLVKLRLVKRGLVKRGLVKRRLVKCGLVKRGLVKQEEKYVITKEITISKGVHLLCVCLVPGQ